VRIARRRVNRLSDQPLWTLTGESGHFVVIRLFSKTHQEEFTMSKLLSILLAAAFAAVTITPVAIAAEPKKEEKKEMKKEAKHKEKKEAKHKEKKEAKHEEKK